MTIRMTPRMRELLIALCEHWNRDMGATIAILVERAAEEQGLAR
jgi:hypothetical protein